MKLLLSLFLIFEITVVSGILNPEEFGYGGGGSRHDDDSDSWASSNSDSDEDRGHGHHHNNHHGHGHGRPPRPRPPRPPAHHDPTCEDGWLSFDRPQGTWCIKVFYGPATQAEAQGLCVAQQATLTGVQDDNERLQIAASGRDVVNQNGGGEADIWLGAARKSNCPVKTSCAPMDTFEWTDGSTTGIAGFHWGTYEPNGVIFPNEYSNQPWGQQNCLVELINGNGGLTKFGYNEGDMDDQHCQNSFRMYACGKRAE